MERAGRAIVRQVEAMTEHEPVAEHQDGDPDPDDRELTSHPPHSSGLDEIPVGLQVLDLPEEIAAAMSQRGQAGLRSLAGTRVSLENVRGRLLVHFGDVDHDTADP
jgi:hypothetical protein